MLFAGSSRQICILKNSMLRLDLNDIVVEYVKCLQALHCIGTLSKIDFGNVIISTPLHAQIVQCVRVDAFIHVYFSPMA